ncbi:carboxylic ester hydrolase activity [Vibrio sp. B1FIG11]|uniref:gamma-mobile-trio protein GmtX n=1 Tax=Vibrio sp. B1FIG11 TaxID=2751177 RepID=UPI0015F3541E|nr:gamma-mobile-trio protein GmtX [Vibrio sp. B1FIG11]CAE6879565.1 carboxylic ester hydrolase activity [Vibrio sp. B1FIG11]
MSEITPEQVLNQLKKKASSRVQNSLEAVFTICKEQQERGLNDFSYSTIARLGKGRGVPAAQSIRNKTGESYRTLIASFNSSAKDQPRSARSTSKGKMHAWIDELDDPVVKLQANILYAQKKEAERLLNEVVPINQVIEVFDNVDVSFASIKLTELERSALEYLISSEFLRRHQLELGKNGSIVSSDTQKSFFPVATLDAIKKALQNL